MKQSHILPMGQIRKYPFMASFAMAFFTLTSCVNTPDGSANSDHGPFDRNGNYVEEWADNPKYGRGSSSAPSFSDVDENVVASNTTPLPTNTIKSIPSVTPTTTAKNTSTKPKSSTVVKTTTKPKVVASTKPKVTPKVSSIKKKPVPKVTARRVTAKKGDTLYGLAIRYKSSVTAIQKANGLKSTNLAIGKSLVIP